MVFMVFLKENATTYVQELQQFFCHSVEQQKLNILPLMLLANLLMNLHITVTNKPKL